MNVHFYCSNSLSGSDRHAYTGNKTLFQRIWLTVSLGDVYNLKITFPVFDCTRKRQQNTKTVVVLQFILLSPVKLAGIIQTALHWSLRYFKPEGRIQRTRKPMSTLQWWEVLSLHTSQVAHKAGAYPRFCSMKRLWTFLLPLDGMHWQVRVKCFAQEHYTCPPPGLEQGPLDPQSSALTMSSWGHPSFYTAPPPWKWSVRNFFPTILTSVTNLDRTFPP